MAVEISPHTAADMWTDVVPQNVSIEVTATRLQVLLFNIFQVLEMECKGASLAEKDLTEAIKLISDMKMLGKELEQKLADADWRECEDDPNAIPSEDTLQKQLDDLQRELENTNEEKKRLEKIIASKEATLTAASMDKERLEGSMESLQVELKERQKIDEVIGRILDIPEDSVDKEAMHEWETLKTKLRLQETMEEECDVSKKRLWEIIDTLNTQQVSLMEQNLLLDAALNISTLSNSITKDELQKIEKANQRVRKLMDEAKGSLLAQMDVLNYPLFLTQTCAYHLRKGLVRKVEKLNNIVALHSNTMDSYLVSEFPTYREGYRHRLRKVQKGKLRNHALFDAVKEDNAEAVFILLRNHADPNRCDEEGMTPLQWAARKGYIAVAEVLIQYGHILDVDNPVAGCLVSTPLHMAALEGDVQMAELFLDLGADINAETRDASTPLHLAVKEGKEDMVKLLVSRGADITKRNHIGNSPMDLAIAKKYENIQNLLQGKKQ